MPAVIPFIKLNCQKAMMAAIRSEKQAQMTCAASALQG